MMIDLWTLLVIDLFQSFWMAVIAVAALLWVIMAIGNVSRLTTGNFVSLFILTMALGYGFTTISILIFIGYLVLHLLAIPRVINS